MAATLPSPLTSCILRSQVLHQRLRPRLHSFVYPVFYVRVQLDELPRLQSSLFGFNRWRPLSLYAKDYGPRDGANLLLWMRQVLANANIACDGPVYLQTMPRVFGFSFNPISLWYCYNQDGALRAVLAEVNNTFGEHHFYLLQTEDGQDINAGQQLSSKKLMHVSPFCEVKGHYRFRFVEKEQHSNVQIDYFDSDEVLIETAIASKKEPWTNAGLLMNLLRQPLLSLGVVWRIHWHALLLWRKRVPFFSKPVKSAHNGVNSASKHSPIPHITHPSQSEGAKAK